MNVDYEVSTIQHLSKEVPDGIYFSLFINEDGDRSYRKITVKGEDVYWITVRNNDVKSITVDRSYFNMDYWIAECFREKKGYSFVDETEFKSEFESVLLYFQTL